jgi:hypothetical protein
MMMRKKMVLGMIAAAGMFGGMVGASAQNMGNTMTCAYPWCVNYVEVSPSGQATVYWSEMRMVKKLTGATIAWKLVGAPGYEFRGNSVVITGVNAPGSSAQFPLRQVLADRYSLDDLNTNDLTYTYEVRVYRTGSPPDAAPITATGSVINAFN